MIGFDRATATLAYLVMVLLLGGASAAGFSGNLLLQVSGAALIGWTWWEQRFAPATPTGLRRFAIALGLLAAVQFVPMPPALWQVLPGRDQVMAGFDLLGVEAPWLTLSLAPWNSLGSLTWWIPALALFLSMRAEGAPDNRAISLTIAGVASVSVALGALQRVGGSGYLYQITNYGEGPGFFANSNHQGSFLLCALALWGGYVAFERASTGPRQAPRWFGATPAVLGALALLLLMGVLVSGSLACIALLIPVSTALFAILRPDLRVPLPLVALAAVLALAGFAAFLLYGPVANDLTAKGTVAGIGRQEFLITGSRILGDFAPLGSGLGTFQDLYRWYEDAAQVGTTYVNHAHNDLLELLIETGIFGLAALGLFLAWFVLRAWRLWRGERGAAMALAASIVIAVELAHSLVEYPLRTAAMSSLFAIACVMLVRQPDAPRGRSRGGPSRTPAVPAERGLIRI
jgi:putative inorganic carbon (HCO3(-)) transporter